MKYLLAAIALLACAAANAQVLVDLPIGGWRAPADARTGFVQEVNYPASSVNSDGKATPALIRGRVQQRIEQQIRQQIRQQAATARKPENSPTRLPATLVANGVAMPLSVDESGSFNRPYAFGSGSNSIEIRAPGKDPNPQSRKSVQFYDTGKDNAGGRTVPGMRVVLSWSSDNTDLDLHVITPAGAHAFYGNRILPDGSALDVDVTTGYGPEIWAAPAPARGVYHVYVNYFGAGEIQDALTIAEVAIVTREGSLHEKRQVFRVPLRKPGELMLVKSFVY